MKGLKTGLILIFFVVGMFLVLQGPRPSSREVKSIKEDMIDTINLKTYQEVRVYVKSVHSVLDEELNDDGKLQFRSQSSTRWNKLEKTLFSLEHDLIKGMAILNASSSLHKDLEAAKDKLTYARQNKDLQALIDSHNIVHDLEHFFFYYDREKQYFGATKTLSGKVKNN